MYIDELEQIQDGVHVTATIIDLGNAIFELGIGAFQINMDGKQAVRLVQDILVYSLALMQFESWTYVKKHGADWAGCSRPRGRVLHKVYWITPRAQKGIHCRPGWRDNISPLSVRSL